MTSIQNKNREELQQNESIDEQFKLLNRRHNNIYQFVMLYYNYIISKHDYGTGESLSMIESHTITFIEEHPATTVSELADYLNRTNAAISQTVSKLERKEYIRKEQSTENGKSYWLFVTEKGLRLSKAHKKYDISDITKTMSQLEENCTKEEIDAFFKVIKEYIVLVKNDFR